MKHDHDDSRGRDGAVSPSDETAGDVDNTTANAVYGTAAGTDKTGTDNGTVASADKTNSDMRALSDEQIASVGVLAQDNVYTKQSKWKTFRELPVRDKWPFFVQHFLLGVVAVLMVLALVISYIVTLVTKAPDPYLSVEALNMHEYSSQLTRIRSGFLRHESIDDERLVGINADLNVSVGSSERKEDDGADGNSVDDSAKILVQVTAGQINAFISTRQQFPQLQQHGYTSKLEDGLSAAQMKHLANIGALLDSNGVPVADPSQAYGLDLSKSSVWKGESGLPSDAVLALANLESGTKYVRDFVNYLDFH